MDLAPPPNPICLPDSHSLPERDLVPPRPWPFELHLIGLGRVSLAVLGQGANGMTVVRMLNPPWGRERHGCQRILAQRLL